MVSRIICSKYVIIDDFYKNCQQYFRKTIYQTDRHNMHPENWFNIKAHMRCSTRHRHLCLHPCVHMPMPLLSSVTMSARMCPGPRPSPPLPAPLCAHAHPLPKSFLSRVKIMQLRRFHFSTRPRCPGLSQTHLIFRRRSVEDAVQWLNRLRDENAGLLI